MTRWLARAKVNLVLDVVGLRSDGYHELNTVFQSIELADLLTVRPADHIEVICDAPGIPAGPGNLAFRAAELLRRRTGTGRGCAIEISKRIPAGAGLGGGSADAAAALVALNELWELGLELTDLATLGAEVGSDVPFMVAGGTSHAVGRGEVLRQVSCDGSFPVAVVVPPVAVATAGAYQAVDRWPSPVHPDVRPALTALATGNWSALAGAVANSFEAPIAAREPAIAEALATLRAIVPAGVVMSGSGSSLVVVAPTPEQVCAIKLRLPHCFVWAGLTASAGVSRFAEN